MMACGEDKRRADNVSNVLTIWRGATKADAEATEMARTMVRNMVQKFRETKLCCRRVVDICVCVVTAVVAVVRHAKNSAWHTRTFRDVSVGATPFRRAEIGDY